MPSLGRLLGKTITPAKTNVDIKLLKPSGSYMYRLLWKSNTLLSAHSVHFCVIRFSH
jgi:hypothetical protein